VGTTIELINAELSLKYMQFYFLNFCGKMEMNNSDYPTTNLTS